MIDKGKVLYLAVPYSPTEKQVAAILPRYKKIIPGNAASEFRWAVAQNSIMSKRAEESDKAAAWLMSQGYTVLSPISHSHGIAQHMTPEARTDHELWMRQDKPFVQASDVMVILTLDGWRESKGIKHEIREFAARRRGLNRYMSEFDCKTCRNVFFLNRIPGGYEIGRRPA